MKSGAFATTAPNDAFIYTIWDGGGTDLISADGFYESGAGASAITGAEIDLRQGAFSSIGSSVTAARATENVAIAYHSIIENATGSIKGDVLVGNAWDNILKGEAGNDILYGDGLTFDNYVGFGVDPDQHDSNNGNNTASSYDEDELYGHSGNDLLYGGYGSDRLDGGSGDDEVNYSLASVFIKITAIDEAAGDFEVEKWYAGSDPFSDPADDTDTLYSIEDLKEYSSSAAHGAAFQSDSYGGVPITGDNNANSLWVTSGAATISGLGGNDSLAGASDNDKLIGGDGDDTLNGWGGNDELLGGAGEDTLYGSTGDDYLYGGAGDDYISGGQGSDMYVYSGGNDTFHEHGGHQDDVDTLRFNDGSSFASLSFARHGSSADIEITTGSGAVVTLKDQAHFSANIDLLELSDGTYDMKDILVPVYGTGSADYILGSYSLHHLGTHSYEAASLDDVIYGNGGNDSIYAGDGNNTVFGGTGNDTIYGGDDSDLLKGDGGNDRLHGEGGNDFLYGGDGSDTLYGGYGADVLYGGSGNDIIYTGNDSDLVFGGAGNDTIYTTTGADTIVLENGGGQDTVWYFNTSHGDAFDLSDLLSTYDSLQDDIAKFVEVTSTKISVDASGQSNFTQVASLVWGSFGTTDVVQLEANGTIITA
ncbi:MAG: calcium-binding protein [Pseudomonadota bacterium]